MSVGWVVQTQFGVAHEASVVQSAKHRKGFTVVSTGDLIATYTGSLAITRANGVSLAARTGVPTTVKTAVLQITAQSLDGQVLGILTIGDLGLGGTLGPVSVSGTIIRKRVNLILTDSAGFGVGSISGKIGSGRQLITAKFVSRVDFGRVVGQLRVARSEQTFRFDVDRDP
jgi:hypothetical protein